MSIYGTCGICGRETRDYGCQCCLGREVGTSRLELDAALYEVRMWKAKLALVILSGLQGYINGSGKKSGEVSIGDRDAALFDPSKYEITEYRDELNRCTRLRVSEK